MSNNHLTNKQFKDFPLPQPLLNSLEQSNFSHCTPIQAESLPVTLENNDVIGQAQTGTGKTIAFLIAAFTRLYNADVALANPALAKVVTEDNAATETATEAKTPENSPESIAETNTLTATTEAPAADAPVVEADATEIVTADEKIDMANVVANAQKKRGKNPRAIIIAPTRELALQIYEDAKKLNTELNYRIALAYGGNNYKAQQEVIEAGVDIVIGTPGRLIDFNKQKLLKLQNIEVLVLDEADRMFDLGFLKDIRFLLRRLPDAKERLNMLFSATVSYDVEELAYEHMNSPTNVAVASTEVEDKRIEEKLYFPASDEKLPLLVHLIESTEMQRGIVFINTKHVGERVAQTLIAMNHNAGIISGDVAQNKREKLLDDFRKGDIKILVATDVAARGIHIDDVDYVINYDLPNHVEDYVHRIGRTARAGASGHAISFACETYSFILPDIEEFIEHKIPVQSIDSDAIAKITIPSVRIERKERVTRGNPRSNSNATTKKPPQAKAPYVKNTQSDGSIQAGSNDNSQSVPRHLQETKMVETPVGNADSNRDNRIFSKHGYEIPAFG